MTNLYMQTEITNQIASVQRFATMCEMAALKDDGKTSKEEAKILEKIKKASEKYIKELNSIL